MPRTYTIKVIKGAAEGQSFTLPQNGQVYVGRHSSCAIRIIDPDISRHQALFSLKLGRWFVEPVSQGVQTFIDEFPIDGPQQLHDTDHIRFGNNILEIEIDDPESDMDEDDAALLNSSD